MGEEVSRYGVSKANGQRVQFLSHDCYRISWWVDRYYPTSRLRHPVGQVRITDEAGAKRFCKKWGLEMPEPPK
jgi:hypothetical protein